MWRVVTFLSYVKGYGLGLKGVLGYIISYSTDFLQIRHYSSFGLFGSLPSAAWSQRWDINMWATEPKTISTASHLLVVCGHGSFYFPNFLKLEIKWKWAKKVKSVQFSLLPRVPLWHYLFVTGPALLVCTRSSHTRMSTCVPMCTHVFSANLAFLLKMKGIMFVYTRSSAD